MINTRAHISALLFFTITGVFFYKTNIVLAQNSFLDLFSPEQGEEGGVLSILENLTKTFRTIVLPLLTLVVFWAGYTMATAQGNEQQYTLGKKILLRALIGTAIVSVAPLLVNIAQEFKDALQ